MKRIVTLSIGMLALAGTTLSTQAADLGARPMPSAPILAPTPVANWSGFYLGLGVGGRWSETDWQTTCLAPLALGTAGCPNDVFFPALASRAS
jgi:outer membrane immunogenic protein